MTKSLQQAQVKYNQYAQDIQKYIATIQKDIVDFQDNPNWGEVGSIAHYAEVLKDLHDSITGEGEYAE